MIYLDWNSTTPVLPEVLEAMMPYLTSVLAAAEPYQPRAVILQVKMAKEISNIYIRSSCHENHCLRLTFVTGNA